MTTTTNSEELVYGLRLSTVVPGRATGEGKVQQLSSVDIAMKLHYLKAVYFFTHQTSTGGTTKFLSIYDLKNSQMFDWLETYLVTCGRVRTDAACPLIKLNDAGVRIVEAQASKTVEEWLAMDNLASVNDQLIYTEVLGPDLGFTPLVFIQVSWFKCGGVSVGLSWAHILGDAFTASTFMNELGVYLRGQQKPAPKILGDIPNKNPSSTTQKVAVAVKSIKEVNPVGDSWVVPNNCKMGTHSFEITQKQLVRSDGEKCFEAISAMVWKTVAKIRKEKEPQVVTVCRPRPRPESGEERVGVIPYNGQMIGIVKAESKVSKTEVGDLEALIAEKMVDESEDIEEYVKEHNNNSDVVVYGGANLTFVDFEEANVYGFQLKGKQPVFASLSVNGVGDEGAVFILPASKNGSKLIIITLPQHEIHHLKLELNQQWSIA